MNNKSLASLVLIWDEKLNFYNFQVADTKLESWRVDDDGVFGGDDIYLLFVYERGNEIGVAYGWEGFEGNSLQLLETDKNGFKEVVSGYHYHAPQ